LIIGLSSCYAAVVPLRKSVESLPTPPPTFPHIEPRHEPEAGPSRVQVDEPAAETLPPPLPVVHEPDESPQPPCKKTKPVRSVGASSRGGGATVKARDKSRPTLRVISPEEERELDEADLRSLYSGSGTGSSILTSSTRTQRTAAGKVGSSSRGAGAGPRPPPRASRKKKPPSSVNSTSFTGDSFETHLAELSRLKSAASSLITSTTGTSFSRSQTYGRATESFELSSLRFSNHPEEEDQPNDTSGDKLTADNLAAYNHLRTDEPPAINPSIVISPFDEPRIALTLLDLPENSLVTPHQQETEWDVVSPPPTQAEQQQYTGPRFVIRDGIRVEMSANTSHLMKTTRRGRPFVKVSADVFFEVGLRKAEEI
jgi:hypothetical protein